MVDRRLRLCLWQLVDRIPDARRRAARIAAQRVAANELNLCLLIATLRKP